MRGTETLVGVSLCVLYYSHADTFTMKSIIALAIAVPFLTQSAAHAYGMETTRYHCTNYRETERFVPGYYTESGNWVAGRIVQTNHQVPCDMPHATHVSHGYHQQNNYYPQQYPQQQQQPLIINNQPPAHRGGRCDQLARMGLGLLEVDLSLVISSVVVKSRRILLETQRLVQLLVESLDASYLADVPVT